MTVAADEIKKESTIKVRGNTKFEIDTYSHGTNQVLKVERFINIRDGKKHQTHQKVLWKNEVVLEVGISHIGPKPGQFIQFHSIPGVNIITDADLDGTIKSISLATTNLTALRSFKVLDGLLSPLPMTEVKRANALQKEVKDLFQDFHNGDTSGDEFMDKAKDIVKKCKKEDNTTKRSFQ